MKDDEIDKIESLEVEKWFDEHGDGLFRFALLRVGDEAKAEDLIQETFLAALQSKESFAGRSSVRSWLIGILKHKIADSFRKESREKRAKEELEVDDGIHEPFGIFCWAKGFGPKLWDRDPHQALEEKRFLKVIEECLDNIPEALKKVFILREMEEYKTQEIEEIIGANSGYIRVKLHRARVFMRACVEKLWLKDSTEGEMK
jgi:RNA polymerase sigma-70 factor, ECF subfamily